MTDIEKQYALWCKNAVEDPDVAAELSAIAADPEAIRDRFYQELNFGTAGLRGVIGAGENRMNIYTVRRATQGLAAWMLSCEGTRSAAVAYDSRHKSALFARETARVLAGNGITVYLYPQLEPVPVLSYTVRRCGCQAGVMITASHNPAKYNGYKVYGADGCQLTDHDAGEVTRQIRGVDIFSGVRLAPFDEAKADGQIRMVGQDVLDGYMDCVLSRQVLPGVCEKAGLRLIYTPLNGAGNVPVREMLRRIGAKEVTVVPEQELPDGDFPTAPYPNPEIRQAFDRALVLAETVEPDLLLATDPDCDRVGIAVPDGKGGYALMTGNEVGCLLLDYILTRRAAAGTLPERPVAVRSIVTTAMTDAIAADHGCEVREVLTGFKYIGEQIALLEAKGEAERFVLGYEESYGYLSGTYVRDKDAVVASMLIVEMAAFYRAQGMTLLDRMQQLYARYGFYRNAVINVAFEGERGMAEMDAIMTGLRTDPPAALAGQPVTAIADYREQVRRDLTTNEKTALTLPRSNVLSFRLADGAGVIVRPSGTEPKIKAYVTVIGRDADDAAAREQALLAAAHTMIGGK